ncbi:alpha/beta fold hydrolase [Thermodesulfobacteriota bacterium]
MNPLVGLVLCAIVANPKELFSLSDFYETPVSFVTTGKPGDLIRSMEFDGYKLPQGIKAIRILYGTTNSRSDLVTSSGVVLFPQGAPPEEGWPVIAWAHGTSGINRRCAPSLMAECFSDYEAPITYLERGYAVVATDYAGLGTDYTLDYMDRISNGWDVVNSVKAARKAVPALGRKWVAVGHSAGAHALRGVAELQAELNDSSYLGVVAVSGLGDARVPMVVLSDSMMGWPLALYFGEAVKARYPDFEHADILTKKGLGLLEEVRINCQGPGVVRPSIPKVQGSQVLKKDWHLNPYIDKYFRLDESGKEKYKGPVLVINGEKEPPTTLANDIEAVIRMCEQGVDLQLKIIPGADHFTLLDASIEDQMDWIADRFAGKEATSNCESILK